MKNNKGITLIALVITIIVLVILASVSIAFFTRENGIKDTAKKAAKDTEIAKLVEQIKMETLEYLDIDGTYNLDKLVDVLKNAHEISDEDIVKNETGITVKVSGKTIKIDPNGNTKLVNKLVIAGDSIAYGKGYDDGYGGIIAADYGMELYNIAIDGAVFVSNVSSRGCIMNEMETNIPSDADYIIFEGGVNDAWMDNPLGSISKGYDGPFDTTTFCGAFENALKNLANNHQGKYVGYVFIHSGFLTSEHVWYTSYRPIIKQMLGKWNVPYVDIAEECSNLESNYRIDNIHPNELGYRTYYVPKIETWMNGLTPYTLNIENSNDNVESEDGVVILRSNYSPRGSTFVDNADISINDGYIIEAKINISSAIRDEGENIFSVGDDIATWQGNKIHFYYIKSKNGIMIEIMDGYCKSRQTISVTEDDNFIKIDSTGIYLNGKWIHKR